MPTIEWGAPTILPDRGSRAGCAGRPLHRVGRGVGTQGCSRPYHGRGQPCLRSTAVGRRDPARGRRHLRRLDLADPRLYRGRSWPCLGGPARQSRRAGDRKSTRLNSSHVEISYAVFCLKKKKKNKRKTNYKNKKKTKNT